MLLVMSRVALQHQMKIWSRAGRLDEVVAFYRDGLGLVEIDRFTDHNGYSE